MHPSSALSCSFGNAYILWVLHLRYSYSVAMRVQSDRNVNRAAAGQLRIQGNPPTVVARRVLWFSSYRNPGQTVNRTMYNRATMFSLIKLLAARCARTPKNVSSFYRDRRYLICNGLVSRRRIIRIRFKIGNIHGRGLRRFRRKVFFIYIFLFVFSQFFFCRV